MADRTLGLGIDVDDASLNRAKKRLQDIEQAQEKLRSEFLRGEKSADAFGKELSALEKEAQSLNKALDALEKPREIDVKTEKFDQTSRDVALAGDAESNLRTVGGALGAFGGGAADSAIGKGAELFAVIEAIPRLKEAASALPQTINAAASAIGTSGAGLVGALGVAALATIAFSLVLKEYNKDIQENKTAIQSAIDVIRNYNEFIAGGGTSDAAQERIAELERLRDAELQTAESIKAARDEFADTALVPAFAKLRDDYKEFDTQLKESQGTVGEYDLEIRKLQEAMDNGTLAANDAANAERELAAERTQGILSEAAQAGELEATKLRLADATREQINAELEGLEIRKASLEAELASLKASGDTSEEVQNRIKQLTETLGFLGEQATQLESLRAGAKTDKQVEAEKKLAAAREETAKASSKAAESETTSRRASRPRITSAATIGNLFTARGADASQSDKSELDNARQKAQEIEQQHQDSLLEAQIDFNREREKEARQAEFELAKIGKEAKRNEQEATRERNFAAAADAREDAAEQKQDLKDQLAFEAREREIVYRHQQDGLRRTQQTQLRELQNSLQQRNQMESGFMQNSLNIWEQYFNRLLNMQRRATGESGSTQARGGNQQISMNALSYITG